MGEGAQPRHGLEVGLLIKVGLGLGQQEGLALLHPLLITNEEGGGEVRWNRIWTLNWSGYSYPLRPGLQLSLRLTGSSSHSSADRVPV